jgi:Spy/CpxP family protein refolding chaperone
MLNLSAEQRKQLEKVQTELDAGLAKVLTDEQNKQLKEIRANRFGFPPAFGPILFTATQDQLKLTAEQKTKVESVQKEINPKLEKILRDDQNKQLNGIREFMGRMGSEQPPGGPPGQGGPPGLGGQPGPGGPGGGGPLGMDDRGGNSVIAQALNELQAAIDDKKTTPEQLNDKVAAVRTARKKAREKVEGLQKDLLLLLTPDQEAVLVRLGYID